MPYRPRKTIAILLLFAALGGAVGAPAMAQTGPEFLPGSWAGKVWFWYATKGVRASIGDYSVLHVGSGDLELDATALEGIDRSVTGQFLFQVRVVAATELGRTDRTYRGDWSILGSGGMADVFGGVDVAGTDSPLFEPTGELVPLDIAFTTAGEGHLSVESASCAGIRGTFSTERITTPGATEGKAAGVAFIAPFLVLPVESEALREAGKALYAAAEPIFQSVASPDNPVPSPAKIRNLVEQILEFKQLVADADLCGPTSNVHRPGNAFDQIARMMLDILNLIMASNQGTYSVDEMLDYFDLASALGAFATNDPDYRTAVLDGYQIALGNELDQALLESRLDDVDAIHAAACRWGWSDLKRRSQR